MMTSWHWLTFNITGSLFSSQKASDVEIWSFYVRPEKLLKKPLYRGFETTWRSCGVTVMADYRFALRVCKLPKYFSYDMYVCIHSVKSMFTEVSSNVYVLWWSHICYNVQWCSLRFPLSWTLPRSDHFTGTEAVTWLAQSSEETRRVTVTELDWPNEAFWQGKNNSKQIKSHQYYVIYTMICTCISIKSTVALILIKICVQWWLLTSFIKYHDLENTTWSAVQQTQCVSIAVESNNFLLQSGTKHQQT